MNHLSRGAQLIQQGERDETKTNSFVDGVVCIHPFVRMLDRKGQRL